MSRFLKQERDRERERKANIIWNKFQPTSQHGGIQAWPICRLFIFHESFILWSIKGNCSLRAIWTRPMRDRGRKKNRHELICYCLINAVNRRRNKCSLRPWRMPLRCSATEHLDFSRSWEIENPVRYGPTEEAEQTSLQLHYANTAHLFISASISLRWAAWSLAPGCS